MPLNQTLGHRDQMNGIIGNIPKRKSFKKLKKLKHRVFTELHKLSGVEYQEKLNELK